MPFTFAHPAAVLPLRALGIPVTAFVVGSMVPDVPLFVDRQGYATTHSAVGIITVDLVVGLVALALWWLVVRDAVVDLSPSVVRDRLAPRRLPTRREVLLAVPALVVGAWSHVFWDSFTHPGRWGSLRVDWLQEEHLGLVGTGWAQFASGVVGLALVGLGGAWFLRGLPMPPEVVPRVLPARTWLVVVAVPVVAFGLQSAASASHGLHLMIFESTVRAIAVGTLTLLVAALVWHLRRRSAGARAGEELSVR